MVISEGLCRMWSSRWVAAEPSREAIGTTKISYVYSSLSFRWSGVSPRRGLAPAQLAWKVTGIERKLPVPARCYLGGPWEIHSPISGRLCVSELRPQICLCVLLQCGCKGPESTRKDVCCIPTTPLRPGRAAWALLNGLLPGLQSENNLLGRFGGAGWGKGWGNPIRTQVAGEGLGKWL